MKYLAPAFVILFLMNSFSLKAQAPIIYSVDHYTGPAGHSITITGANFGTVKANLVVYFGAAKASVLSVTDQILQVAVPAGATFENISVTNKTTGLTVYSHDQFHLAYGGEHPFGAANLGAEQDFQASSKLYDLELCDLDGDGKSDVMSVNDSPSAISLFLNTSTVGAINFTKSTLNLGANTLQVRAGDLNGDGLKDIVITEGGSAKRVFVLQNSSTPGSPSFSNTTPLTLSGKPKRVDIADIDLDGKPDLIITDQAASDFTIVPNTSTIAAISFGTPQVFTVSGAASTDGLAIEDINGDHTPDIIVNQSLAANSNIFIYENKSTPGNINFNSQITLTVAGTLVNVRIGDLDGDGKPDIAATQLLNAGISMVLNKGGNGVTKFSDPQLITTVSDPWGIEFTDLDGDGKNDIVTGSIIKDSLTILNNESTPGNLSFKRTDVVTNYIVRHIRAGDLDGDSKPDIVFTSVDNTSVISSKISLFRNKDCFVPVITPGGPLTICSTFTQRLKSSESPGVTYTWLRDGTTTLASGTTPYFDVNGATATSGLYTVTAVGEGGSCTKVSNSVNITVAAAAAVGVSTVNALPAPVCIQGNLTLTASSAGANGFDWTGPNSFTASGASVPRNNFAIEDAGIYHVNIKVGTCIARQDSITVEAVALPDFKVGYPGSLVICSGNNKVLTASPISAAFTYQWYEKTTGLIAGEIATTYTASQTGDYYFKAQSLTHPGCAATNSDTTNIVVVSTPVAAFNAPAATCVNTSVTFVNQSVTDPSATATYAWDFGDTQTSADAGPSHVFSAVQSYTVKLTVSYSGSCSVATTQTITVAAAPTANITTPSSVFKFCSGDSLQLAVSSSFASYTWSTSETSPGITVKNPGNYSVDLTTTTGCTLTLAQAVDTLASPIVTVSATPDHITAGETSQLNASGITDYLWHPGKYLSDSTSANPIATPAETVAFKVSGKGINGCTGYATLTVNVKGEAIVDKLTPANFFSPNGDNVNNQWSVTNITNYPQCHVSIYDDKGVKVFDAKPYLNSWDGTFNGRALPDGVYYYIIRCDGEESHPRTGSITLLR